MMESLALSLVKKCNKAGGVVEIGADIARAAGVLVPINSSTCAVSVSTFSAFRLFGDILTDAIKKLGVQQHATHTSGWSLEPCFTTIHFGSEKSIKAQVKIEHGPRISIY